MPTFFVPKVQIRCTDRVEPIVLMVKSYIWCTDRLLWRVPVDAWQGGVQAQNRRL